MNDISQPRAVEHVFVVGAGAMGSQIAMSCALHGYRVTIQDIAQEGLDRAHKSLSDLMESRVTRGRMSDEDRQRAFDRLQFTTDLELARDADLVIEAAVENLDAKREIFAKLDKITPDHAILASNSSSFVPSKLAEATGRADRVVNIHFFNPALVMKCVEVVRGPETSDVSVETAVTLVRSLEKTPVVMDKEINGFIANRILNAIRDEAVFLMEGGYASITDIDLACKTALGHPKGPFELQDMTGLDIGHATKLGRFAETGDPADAPQRSLDERVRAGHLGRKTGQGWYRYDADGNNVGEA